LGNPKESFSTVLFIHTSGYLRYLTRKQSVIHLPKPPENVTTLTCELQNFFIWLKVCCVISNVGGSEKAPNISRIFGSAGFIFFKDSARKSTTGRNATASTAGAAAAASASPS